MADRVKISNNDGNVQVILESNGRLLVKHGNTYLDITAHETPMIRIHGPRRMSLRNEIEDGNAYVKELFRGIPVANDKSQYAKLNK